MESRNTSKRIFLHQKHMRKYAKDVQYDKLQCNSDTY